MPSTEAAAKHERGALSYDAERGHVCTVHGETVAVVRGVTPTDSGSYFYRCLVCGAGGWSGL